MRRVAALSALVLSTALVAGCSGGPEALSYDEAKDTLLSEDAFPLDGFTRTINDDQGTESQDDQPMTDIVGVFQGVPSGCTDAARAVDDGDTFTDYDETDSPSASFRKGDQHTELRIAEKPEDYEDGIKAVQKVAEECGELSGGPSGMSVTFEEVDEDDAEGMELVLNAGGQEMRLSMLATAVGENVVYMVRVHSRWPGGVPGPRGALPSRDLPGQRLPGARRCSGTMSSSTSITGSVTSGEAMARFTIDSVPRPASIMGAMVPAIATTHMNRATTIASAAGNRPANITIMVDAAIHAPAANTSRVGVTHASPRLAGGGSNRPSAAAAMPEITAMPPTSTRNMAATTGRDSGVELATFPSTG